MDEKLVLSERFRLSYGAVDPKLGAPPIDCTQEPYQVMRLGGEHALGIFYFIVVRLTW